ncbi:MAG: PD-(D/E)XK nuclease family protein [Gammaproteobacteria bacterium]|jgi:hypothetical protein|nr:PD-(D/E)XK nuclease family protein [Gammaproteobacteria bacterium]MBT4606825.1 PD-(D/E)XK nuclease family protein [Thiotrichales bacterium]MBT5467902.1 PD-(D/E)XK nuclease family protein [Candidatus Neomarinimicrobiota bacterium]MBT4328409.1 PD-(D/E)XK nuclease family protein [Gammaproteobacteria bacterium]MBT5372845.1 PD-(D/E)XK nuclease family protein [Gammaproteobacteria bacterium]
MSEDITEVELEGFISEFKKNGGLDELPVDQEKMSTFYGQFGQLWGDEIKKGTECNIWDVAGLKRDELRNSAVLAWLLNPQGTHGQGALFLESFGKLLGPDFEGIDVSVGTCVYVESLPLGDQESRVDIELNGDEFLLFIEVKIDAPEQPDQVDRYRNIASRKAENKKHRVCFLTPTGKDPKSSSASDNVISISWKNCADALKNAEIDRGSFVGLVALQFCEHIEKF